MYVSLEHLYMSPAGASGTPLWPATFGTVAQIITAAGIIIGGAFAYFKLVKGRAFRPRAEIVTKPRIVSLNGDLGLHIPIRLQNSGQVSLLFSPRAPQQVYLSQIKADTWNKACRDMKLVPWEKYAAENPFGIALPEGRGFDQAYKREKLSDLPADNESADSVDNESAESKKLAERLAEAWGLNELNGCEKIAPGESWIREILIPIKSDTVACLVRVSTHPCTHVARWRAPVHKRRCCQASEEEDDNAELNSRGLRFWKDVFVTIPERGV